MKKTIYSLVVFGILIAGCSQSSNSNSSFSSSFESSNSNGSTGSTASTTSSFDGGSTSVAPSSSEDSPDNQFNGFSNLKIDLSSIKQIGMYKNSQASVNGRKYNQNTNQNSTYLIGYNENGEAMPLIYLNSQDEIVQNPYSVFSLEVVGDFSYIVFYNDNHVDALNLLNEYLRMSTIHGSQQSRSLGSTTFEVLFKAVGGQTVFMSLQERWAFIILHNQSGKLFNADAAVELSPYLDDNDSLVVSNVLLFSMFENKIIYFVKRVNTCKGTLVFDEANNTLSKTEVCTSLDIIPIFVHNNGYFVYSFNNKVSFASPDFSSTGDLSVYFERLITVNQSFKSVGEQIVLLTSRNESSFLLFSGEFELVEEKSEVYGRAFYVQESVWMFNKNGWDYYDANSIIYSVNFSNFEFNYSSFDGEFPPLNQFFSTYKYLVFEGSLYQIATKIQVLNTENTFYTLESDIYQVNNDLFDVFSSGYLEYSKTQGLTQINKYLNLQTGEIFLESESRPTITVTQVQPIN